MMPSETAYDGSATSYIVRVAITSYKISSVSKSYKISSVSKNKIYEGHTRFATTSKASFDGTHPHQVFTYTYMYIRTEQHHYDHDSQSGPACMLPGNIDLDYQVTVINLKSYKKDLKK